MKTYIKFLTIIFFKSLFFVFFTITSLVFILNLLSELDFFRKIEVESYFPIFLSIISKYPNYNFIIAGVNNVDPKINNWNVSNVEFIGQTFLNVGPREWMIFIAWFAYLIYFHIRFSLGALGKRLAHIAIACYILQIVAIVSMIGIHKF